VAMSSADANAIGEDFVVLSSLEKHHGIPEAVFFTDVASAVAKHGVQTCLEKLNGLYSKYKFWESKFVRSRTALLQKIPEIRRAIDAVVVLESKQAAGSSSCELNFELADQLFARAKVEAKNVCIWLGANVMVEYPFGEAKGLLQKNLTTAEKSLADIERDLAFLRDQVNVCEVNMTRVYNHDIVLRRKASKPAASAK